MRTDLKNKTGRSFDEMMKNAEACLNKNSIELSGRNQARCDVLESIAELSGMTLDERLKDIEESYKGVELEAMLNISPNYYRDRYFALLELVATSIKTDK